MSGGEVQLVTNVTQLARTLYAATLTVLLLTSPFSSETPSALRALSRAAALCACPSVQYVQLPLHAGHRARQPRQWQQLTRAAPDGAHNLSRAPPLFPFVRLFHAERAPHVRAFYGSFDAPVLARFICDACDAPLRFPRMSSRDEFARALRRNASGALLVTRVGDAPWQARHAALAHALAREVRRRATWVFSVVDSHKDVLFARRVANESLLFVHVGLDKAVVHDASRVDARDMAQLMQRFERMARGTLRLAAAPHVAWRARADADADADAAALAYFDEGGGGAARRLLAAHQSGVSLRAVVRAQYDAATAAARDEAAVLWVVVVQTWCAFCQRVLPVYERFAQLARGSDADVHVLLFAQRPELLPAWAQPLVDGFPTVVRAELRHGVREAHEYVGEHRLRHLIDEHRDAHSRALRAAF